MATTTATKAWKHKSEQTNDSSRGCACVCGWVHGCACARVCTTQMYLPDTIASSLQGAYIRFFLVCCSLWAVCVCGAGILCVCACMCSCCVCPKPVAVAVAVQWVERIMLCLGILVYLICLLPFACFGRRPIEFEFLLCLEPLLLSVRYILIIPIARLAAN